MNLSRRPSPGNYKMAVWVKQIVETHNVVGRGKRRFPSVRVMAIMGLQVETSSRTGGLNRACNWRIVLALVIYRF